MNPEKKLTMAIDMKAQSTSLYRSYHENLLDLIWNVEDTRAPTGFYS